MASAMSITPNEGGPEDTFKVEGYYEQIPYEEVVDERTARLLERAKAAGWSELAREIRQKLEMNY